MAVTAQWEGEIHTRAAVIAGKITGRLVVEDKLEVGMTAVAPTSSLSSTTSRPVTRPAMTAEAAWISPSHCAVTAMRSAPPTRPSPRTDPHTMSGPGVSRSPVNREPSETKVGESPI